MKARILGALACLTLAAARPPGRTDYLFALDGVPVGTVELTWSDDGHRFRYTSTHWMHPAGSTPSRQRSADLGLDGQGRIEGSTEQPAAVWLGRPRKPGCAAVRDELSGASGEACVQRAGTEWEEGTLLGKRFQAHYGTDGRLERLELDHARFTRLERPLPAQAPPDVLATAPPIQGRAGLLQLEPGVATVLPELPAWRTDEALRVLEQVRAQLPPTAECIEYAQRFERLARAPSGPARAAVVYGFYAPVSAPRARAHAWVVVRTERGLLELDPALDVPVARETHLILGTARDQPDAGEHYLKVFDGHSRLVRRSVQSR